MATVYKHYVGVISYINMEGKMRPIYIVWNESVKYKIEHIYSSKQSISLAGGNGILYDCKVEGKRIHLFKERERWFIESKLPPVDYWVGS